MVLNKDVEAFVIYVIFITLRFILIYLDRKAQIALLFVKKVKILAKYLYLFDVFLEKKFLVLPKLIKLNKHVIKL